MKIVMPEVNGEFFLNVLLAGFQQAIADIQLKAICAVFTAVGPVFLSVIHCDLFTICNIEVVLASLSE